MQLMNLCMMAILGAVLTVFWKELRPQIAFFSMLVIGIVLFGLILVRLREAVELVNVWTGELKEETGYLKLLVKMIGITYCCGFCSDICKDAGAGTLAGQIELLGKICIMASGLPVLYGVVDCIKSLQG